jgi:aminoglycoside 2''-phosphotransferase
MNNVQPIETSIALLQRCFPQIVVESALPITQGWDSFVLVVNDEWIFRFPMREDVEERFQREIRLLPVLERVLSTPIPHFDCIGHGDTAEYPYTFVGYRKLGGRPLDDERISQTRLSAFAPALAAFLSELHRFPVEQARKLGAEDGTPVQWRKDYRERYLDLRKRVFPLLDAELCMKSERLWEGFLDTETNFTFESVFIHGDLNCEHILCDPASDLLTAVIDWGDSRIGDPALDFVGLHRQRGKALAEQVLTSYQGKVDTAFWQRMDFYLCYEPYSRLLYGAYSGIEEFVTEGRIMLQAMFQQ